jgi:hypothetical protein
MVTEAEEVEGADPKEATQVHAARAEVREARAAVPEDRAAAASASIFGRRKSAASASITWT